MQPIEQPGTGPDDITPKSQDTHTAESAESGAETSHPRRTRSFVCCAGRMLTGRQRTIDELGPRSQLPYTTELLDWGAASARVDVKRIFEIGFGMGETTVHIVQLRLDNNFLGVEVHEPGVEALLKLIGEREIGNIRIASHDAAEVLAQMIPEDTLDGIHMFSPDPWYKKRHNKRYLIQSLFVARLAVHLKPGGYLRCATGWEEYAHQMLGVLSSEPTLEDIVDGFALHPDYRPVTKFEKRGLRLGYGVWDVAFRKRGQPRPRTLARVSARRNTYRRRGSWRGAGRHVSIAAAP